MGRVMMAEVRPVPVYVPDEGECVRVVEVCPYDSTATVEVGHVGEAKTVAMTLAASYFDGWPCVLIKFEADVAAKRYGTWCRVEPALPVLSSAPGAGEIARAAAEFDEALR